MAPNIINVLLSMFQVQLQLLTAIVKLFLKRPTDTQELVQQVLSLATQVSSSFVIVVNSASDVVTMAHKYCLDVL